MQLIQYKNFKDNWIETVRQQPGQVTKNCNALVKKHGLYQNNFPYLKLIENEMSIRAGSKKVYAETLYFPQSEKVALLREQKKGRLSLWNILAYRNNTWYCKESFILNHIKKLIVTRGNKWDFPVKQVSQNNKHYLFHNDIAKADWGDFQLRDEFNNLITESAVLGTPRFQRNSISFWKPIEKLSWWSSDSSKIMSFCGKAYLDAYRVQAYKGITNIRPTGKIRTFCFDEV